MQGITFMNHQTLALTLIALLSATPIVCIPTSRYQDLMAAQKHRELTSNEKEELKLVEQLKQWETERWKWREKEYVSGIQPTPFRGVSFRKLEKTLPSFYGPFEYTRTYRGPSGKERQLELLEAQKTRELTSDEKEELKQLEKMSWLLSSNSSSANLFSPHFDSGTRRSGGPIYIDKIEDLSYKPREQISEHTSLDTEFGSVVLSGLIKKENASTEKIMPLEKDLFAPIISGYGPIWECNSRRYSRIQHVSTDDWKVIAQGPLEALDTCNQESNNNNNADKHIPLTASLIAANAQTSGVNYERLAESLEQLHAFNTLQAQIDKLFASQ
jgi:hypothetical protein